MKSPLMNLPDDVIKEMMSVHLKEKEESMSTKETRGRMEAAEQLVFRGKITLDWTEENQRLIERFLVLATGRNMCLAHTDKANILTRRYRGKTFSIPVDIFVEGQDVQDLLRELFDKPDLVIQSWDWTDRNDEPSSPKED